MGKSPKMKDMDKDSSVIKLLKNAYEKSGKSYSMIHKETGIVSNQLSRIFNGKQYASLSMLNKIGKAVGLQTKQIAISWKKDKIAEIDAEIAKILSLTT